MSIFKFPDNVDTDVIIPARYLVTSDINELACHCMEDIDSQFAKKVKPGDIIVAGYNFGCGSSREHAPLAIKGCGVKAVIAKSFARIFFRNAINIGLAIYECPEADSIDESDQIEILPEQGVIINKTKGINISITKVPPFIQKIIESGGLIEAMRNGSL